MVTDTPKQRDEGVPGGYEEVYEDARRKCPYMIDREARGLPSYNIIEPAWEDLWAHLAAKGATWAMTKHDARAAVEHKGRLPRGIPPGPHAMCAANLPAPFKSEVRLADDLDYAIRKTVELGPNAHKWRQERFEELKYFMQMVRPRRAELDKNRGFASSRVSMHIKLERIDLARYAVGWPDVELATMLQKGATVTGSIPEAGIYRKADVRAAMSLDEFHASNEEWIDQVCKARPPKPDQIEVIMRKSNEEIEAGLLRGYWTRAEMDHRWGQGQWRCLVRFALWQAGSAKYRIIDNGRTASHNLTLSASERIHTATTDTGAAMIRRLRQHLGHKLGPQWRPRSSTQDMKSAFRQLSVRDADRRYHIVALWIPQRNCWMFAELDGLAFGLGAAVLEFNRCPEHVVAVARRWLAIPAIHFYDDYRLLDVEGSGNSADTQFAALSDYLGYFLDPGKHQLPNEKILFLGVTEEFCEDEYAEDVVCLSLSEEKRLILLGEVQAPMKDLKCSNGEMAHLVGKLIHYGTTVPGRIGMGMLRPLALHAVSGSPDVDELALRSLEFYEDLLKAPRRRVIPLHEGDYHGATVISDASWAETAEDGTRGKVCFMIMDPNPAERWGGVLCLRDGDAVISRLESRKSQILAGELLGPLLALAYAGPVLAHACASFYLDNLSGLCSIVCGASRRTDLASVACGIQVGMDEFRVKGWYDYVESASNITDGGSRIGTTCPLAANYGVPLVEILDFTLPDNYPQATPSEWRVWWKTMLRKAVGFRSRVEHARSCQRWKRQR